MLNEANATVKAEALKAQEAEFLRVNAEAKGVEERRSEVHDSMKSFGDHFSRTSPRRLRIEVSCHLRKLEQIFLTV